MIAISFHPLSTYMCVRVLNIYFLFSSINKAGVPSAALYPPMSAYPFYQPIIQPMVNICHIVIVTRTLYLISL